MPSIFMSEAWSASLADVGEGKERMGGRRVGEKREREGERWLTGS
jgi:hypothetical protein